MAAGGWWLVAGAGCGPRVKLPTVSSVETHRRGDGAHWGTPGLNKHFPSRHQSAADSGSYDHGYGQPCLGTMPHWPPVLASHDPRPGKHRNNGNLSVQQHLSLLNVSLGCDGSDVNRCLE